MGPVIVRFRLDVEEDATAPDGCWFVRRVLASGLEAELGSFDCINIFMSITAI